MATQPTAGLTYAESERVRRQYLRQIASLEKTAAERMVGAYERALARILRELDQQLALVQDRMVAGESFQGALIRISVLEDQRAFVRNEINRFAGTAGQTIDTAAAAAVQAATVAATAKLSGLGTDIFMPNPALIEQLAARTAPGTALAAHLSGMGQQVADTVIHELVQGAILGDNPRVVGRRIRTTLGGQIPHLKTLTRTETLNAARAATLASYRANRDVVKGWIWNATEDRRTCAVCWAMNGSEHALDEDFATHANCRCEPDALTRSWSDILGKPSTTPDLGAQPFNGDNRFRRQPPSVQLAVLGPSKYAAYQSGQLPSISDLAARTIHPKWGPGLRERTLGELGLPRVRQIDLPESVNQDLRIRRAARDRVAQARKAAPGITTSLETALEGTGGALEGLRYAVKGQDSLERKIRSEIIESEQLGAGISVDMATARMKDVNRYTVILEPGEYTDGVVRIVDRLERDGYTFPPDRWKNTWKPGNAYRGINTTMLAPDGTPIEIQFHTRQSFDTKMASHAPYEEARRDTTTPARRRELEQQMADAAKAVRAPAGWQRIRTAPAPRESMGDIRVPVEDFRSGSMKPFVRKGGRIDPARADMHDQIVRDLLRDGVRVEHPTFHMFGGGPASGKGSITIPGEDRMVKIDPDEIKRMLPGIEKMIAERHPEWAAFAHEESSYIAKRALAASMERRYDVILDGTGDGSVDSVRKKIGQGRDANYRVAGNYVTVETQTALKRAKVRGEKTGRVVPEWVIGDTHREVSAIVPQVAADFDEFILRDTSTKPPTIVASHQGGKLTVHDPLAWERFRAKAHEKPLPRPRKKRR